MNPLARAWQPVAAQLSARPWLRGGGRLALLLALGHGVALQHGRLAGVHADYEDALADLDRTGALLHRRDWMAPLETEREAHVRIRSRFWEAETEGLAQAKLQAALGTLFRDVGLRDTRIQSGLNQDAPDLPGVRRVQARLQAAYPPGTEPEMLHALAAYPRQLIVDRLELRRRERGEAQLTLIVSSYFVVGGAGDTGEP